MEGIYGIVYLITNLANEKGYIGQTTRPKARWGEHRYDAVAKRHRQALHRAMAKYGRQNFSFQVVAVASSQEQLDNLERLWVICLRTSKRQYGYNITSGGGSFKHLPETKLRIGEAAKGNKYAAGKPAWNRGQKPPPETCEKIRLANSRPTGRPMPDHVREALRAGFQATGKAKVIAHLKGRDAGAVSEATRSKMKDSRMKFIAEHPELKQAAAEAKLQRRLSKPSAFSQETRRKMSEAAKRRCARMNWTERNRAMNLVNPRPHDPLTGQFSS